MIIVLSLLQIVLIALGMAGLYLVGRGDGKKECPKLVEKAYEKAGGNEDDLTEKDLYPLATNDDKRAGEALSIIGFVGFFLIFIFFVFQLQRLSGGMASF